MAAPTNAANVKKALANSEPSTHGTAVPAIVKWSSVMKSTLQRLHSHTLISDSSSTPGIVRATIIGLEQFGQSGDWGCIFPTDRPRVSLLGSTASAATPASSTDRTPTCGPVVPTSMTKRDVGKATAEVEDHLTISGTAVP